MNEATPSLTAAPRGASLGRAFLLSVAALVALTAAAFWPEKQWTPPARPALKAPIVFDELVNQLPPPSSSSVSPAASAESR